MYWVDDPEFDIEQHLHHVALPKPGDRRELQKMLARLTADLMDMSRPPWDAFVIEGLDNVSGVPQGSIGLLLRIHHAAIDGHSGHALLQALHDPALTGDYQNRTATGKTSTVSGDTVSVPTLLPI